MHEARYIVSGEYRTPEELYSAVLDAVEALIPPGTDQIAAMSTLSSLLYHSLPNINWCGFYRLVADRLIVGPFQGKPACIEIALSRGVCGRAASSRQTVIVSDVTSDPEHIACDPVSRSELVVPLFDHGELIGVLDVDSPVVGRFTADDAQWLELIAQRMVERSRS